MGEVWSKERVWAWYDDHNWLRGCNFMGSDCANRIDQWQEEGFEERLKTADEELALAAETGYNTIRIILEYFVWEKQHDGFMERFDRYLETAWKHGISTNPIIFLGFRFAPDEPPFAGMMSKPGLRPLSKAIEDPSCWYLGEQYFDALYEAIGDEPGLLFWDIANEPGYTDNFVTWYDDEPLYQQDYQERPDMTLLREQNAELIISAYDGLRVPKNALRVDENGVSGVDCHVGRVAYFKPVSIVYQGSDYCLVEPGTIEAATESQKSLYTLRPNDEVIVSAGELYNGKVVD